MLSDTVFDMANHATVGDISEAVVLAEFLKAGFPVLRPFGTTNSRYDLVVEAGGRFLRVQCKTASQIPGVNALRFKARSVHLKTPLSRVVEGRSYRGEADLFAAYSPVTGKVYVLPVDECPVTDVWLRLAPTTANNQHGIRLAEDHTLEAWVARLG
jgi:hypothetical protein